jgi:NAD-dependent DNA ligase
VVLKMVNKVEEIKAKVTEIKIEIPAKIKLFKNLETGKITGEIIMGGKNFLDHSLKLMNLMKNNYNIPSLPFRV